jgi:sulfur-oxidizing protein SoxX
MKLRGSLCLVAVLALFGAGPAAAAAEQNVAEYIVIGNGIPEYLSGKPGDPKKGATLANTAGKGTCFNCHEFPVPEADKFKLGNVGPTLFGVGSRMTEAELRLRLVNPKVVNPDTMMPAYHRTAGLHRVDKKFAGKPILDAQEIEDIVAFLKTLKE